MTTSVAIPVSLFKTAAQPITLGNLQRAVCGPGRGDLRLTEEVLVTWDEEMQALILEGRRQTEWDAAQRRLSSALDRLQQRNTPPTA